MESYVIPQTVTDYGSPFDFPKSAWYVRFLGNPNTEKRTKLEIGRTDYSQPRGYTGIHRYTGYSSSRTYCTQKTDQQQSNIDRITAGSRLVAFGSLGGFWGTRKREGEGENNSAGSVRPPVYRPGWGWGLSQYGKVAWSLFLLVNSLSNG
jgi:hypothetical protein